MEPTVQDQANIFYGLIQDCVDKFAPIKLCKVKNNDKPWVTDYFRNVLHDRDEAFKLGDHAAYARLRNKANRLRKSLYRTFINDKIIKVSNDRGRGWWRDIKSICGLQKVSGNYLDNVFYQGRLVPKDELVDVINEYLKSISDCVSPLQPLTQPNLVCDGSECDGYDIDICEFEVYRVLSSLNITKSCLDSVLDNRLLKYLADLLAAPVCALINNSLRQSYVPSQWKVARIVPVPKCSPVHDIESDVRPISITCPVAKVAEVFISRMFDEFYDDVGDADQFGSVAGRSTTLALIKLCHVIFEASDDSTNMIRILFIDFSRAFDLIDHNVILRKLMENNCPVPLRNWIMSFLNDRVQFVKVENNISGLLNIHAGAPQGTRAGPNCFKLLIRDLAFDLPFVKYVDDVSVVSVSHSVSDVSLQHALNALLRWCNANGMRLNTKKTKEMTLSFSKRLGVDDCAPLVAGPGVIKRVNVFKILGVTLSSDLSWTKHVKNIVSRACKRLFVIGQLVRCGFSYGDIVRVYCALIRPLLEYASPVWHPGLTLALSEEIEHVQMRCLRIILPNLSYSDALFVCGLQRLSDRRESAVIKIFNEIKNPTHVLHSLLPLRPVNPGLSTRDQYPYMLKIGKTSRLSRSLIAYCIGKRL